MLTHRPLSRRHLSEKVAPNALRPVGEGAVAAVAAQQQQQRTPLDTVSSDVLDALLSPRERGEAAAVDGAEGGGRSSNPRDLQALLADVLESSRVRVLVERKEQACRSLDSVLGFVLQSYEPGGSAAEPLAQRLRQLQPTAPYVTISEALKLIKHEEKRYASRSDFNEHVATKLSWLTQQLSAAHERAEIAEEKTARLCECVGALHRARLGVGRRLRSLQAAFTERVTEFRRQEINAEERAEAQAAELRRLREEAELGRRWQRQSRAAGGVGGGGGGALLGRARGRQSVAALPGHSFGGFSDGGALDVAAAAAASAAALAGSAADGAEAGGAGGGGGGGVREAALEEEVARLQGMLEEVRQAEEGRRRKEQMVDAYLSQQQRQIGGVDALDVVCPPAGVEGGGGGEVAAAATAATDRALALCRQRAEEVAVLREEVEAAQRQAEEAAALHRAHAAEARALAEARELAQAEEAAQLREQVAAATEAAEAATDARHATRQRLANLQRLLFNSPSTRDVLALVGSTPAVAAGDDDDGGGGGGSGGGTAAATPPAEMSDFLSELQQNLNEFLAGEAAEASAGGGGAPSQPPSSPLPPPPTPPPLETAEQEAAESPLPSPSPSPSPRNATRGSASPKGARGGGGGGGKQRFPVASPDPPGPRQRALRATEAAGIPAEAEAKAKAKAETAPGQQQAEGCGGGGGSDAGAVQERGTQTAPPPVSQPETGTTRTGAPCASVGVLTDKTVQTAMFDPRTDPWRPDESHANVLRAILATRDYELRTLQKKLVDKDTPATCAGTPPTEQDAAGGGGSGGGGEGDASAKAPPGHTTRKRLMGVVGALRPAAAAGGKGFRFRDDAEVRRCGSNSFDLYLLKCDEVQQLTTILHDLLTEHDRLCKRAAAEAPDGSEERQRAAADGGAERPPLPPPSTAAEATREAQLRAKDVIISAERAENRGLLRCLKRVAKQASSLLSGYLGCESAYACPHCLCPLREPVVLSPCGHVFCAPCLGLPSDPITGGAVYPKGDEAIPACPECLAGASSAAAPVPLLESSMASFERHKAVLTEYCDGVRAVLVEGEGLRDVYKSQQQKQREDSSAAAAQTL